MTCIFIDQHYGDLVVEKLDSEQLQTKLADLIELHRGQHNFQISLACNSSVLLQRPPAETALVEKTPAQQTPSQKTPSQKTSSQKTSSQPTPSQKTLSQPTLSQKTLSQPTAPPSSMIEPSKAAITHKVASDLIALHEEVHRVNDQNQKIHRIYRGLMKKIKLDNRLLSEEVTSMEKEMATLRGSNEQQSQEIDILNVELSNYKCDTIDELNDERFSALEERFRNYYQDKLNEQRDRYMKHEEQLRESVAQREKHLMDQLMEYKRKEELLNEQAEEVKECLLQFKKMRRENNNLSEENSALTKEILATRSSEALLREELQSKHTEVMRQLKRTQAEEIATLKRKNDAFLRRREEQVKGELEEERKRHLRELKNSEHKHLAISQELNTLRDHQRQRINTLEQRALNDGTILRAEIDSLESVISTLQHNIIEQDRQYKVMYNQKLNERMSAVLNKYRHKSDHKKKRAIENMDRTDVENHLEQRLLSSLKARQSPTNSAHEDSPRESAQESPEDSPDSLEESEF